jgi:hypothetical protein
MWRVWWIVQSTASETGNKKIWSYKITNIDSIKQTYSGSKPPPYGISGEMFVGRGLAPAVYCEYIFTAPFSHHLPCEPPMDSRVILINSCMALVQYLPFL